MLTSIRINMELDNVHCREVVRALGGYVIILGGLTVFGNNHNNNIVRLFSGALVWKLLN